MSYQPHIIDLYRGENKPMWRFKKSHTHGGWVHQTQHNIYQLFLFDGYSKSPVWIGLLSMTHGEFFWRNVTKKIGAVSIKLEGSEILFD